MTDRGRKRNVIAEDQDDHVNFGKKAKGRSRSVKETVTKQQAAAATKQNQISVADRVKSNPKRGKIFDVKANLGKKNSNKVVKDGNNNAIPTVQNETLQQVQRGQSGRTDNISKKGDFSLKLRPETYKTKVLKQNTQGINIGDGIIADVDDSEFADDGHQAAAITTAEDSDEEDNNSQSLDMGCTASTVTEADKAKKLLTDHPELKHLFNSMMDERIKEVKDSLNQNSPGRITPGKVINHAIRPNITKITFGYDTL